MTPDRWTEVESLFHAALAQQPEARDAFLVEACGGDEPLRQQVASLLEHDRTDTHFMDQPAIQVAARQLAQDFAGGEIPTTSREVHDMADTPGSKRLAGDALTEGHIVGNFRIVRKIGEGGMGEVYLAEDLKLARRVALKLLPSSLVPDGQAGRRFLREARAASALNHLHIVTIFSGVELEGMSFIVMEYIDGESLRERLLRGPLPLADLVAMGIQIADATGAAHAINIVHRDLKPGNILFTASGQAKIVDFGLAKVADASTAMNGRPPSFSNPLGTVNGLSLSFSHAGSISGTIPYMSPEQTRGEHIDGRSDIFSLGCVLYEAATGRRPFGGDNSTDTMYEIQEKDPKPPSALTPGLPKGFDRIVLRALAKKKEKRYGSAAELATDLRRLQTSLSIRRIVKRVRVPVAITVVLVATLATWNYRRESRLRWAQENVASISQFARDQKFFEAYDLAHEVGKVLPDHPNLREWLPFVTEDFSISTDPPGAEVSLRRFQRDKSGNFYPPERIGTSPIQNRKIARGDYLLMIEKQGYVPILRTMSNTFQRVERGLWVPGTVRKAQLLRLPKGRFEMVVDSYAPIDIKIKLVPQATAPARMVRVPGGPYNLIGVDRPNDQVVQLSDYFIDQFEVTNREFKEFVDAGGYERQEYWKEPFVRDGASLTWDAAMKELVDQTGRRGPRNWSEQRPITGKEDHPVTDITWYEAAAFAEFRGKSLPTVFQWEKAARDGQSTVYWGSVMPWGMVGLNPNMEHRANLNSLGTAPVSSFEFGTSPYGCYHMAGNVAEWCKNASPNGFTTTGGSWHDGPHMFYGFGQFPGFYSAATLGFRCILNLPGATGDQGGIAIEDTEEVPQLKPVSEDVYRIMRSHYEYDHVPLEEEIVEDVSTKDWQRLKVTYVGGRASGADGSAPGSNRALAYLWLPHRAARPLQIVNYKPGGASYSGLTVPQETEVVCGPILDSGRAVFVTVVEGMLERDLPPDWKAPDMSTIAYRDSAIQGTVDQRRGLDYLATRQDVDMNKIVCMGLSAGGNDLPMMAVEERFKGTLLLSAGISNWWAEQNVIAEADPTNFAPYVKGPKLMIHGLYDEGIPFRTAGKPLFEILSEPKELKVLKTGHFPPMDQWVPPALQWLDKVLGYVEKEQRAEG